MWLFGEEGLDEVSHFAYVEGALDGADREVFSYDDVSGEGVADARGEVELAQGAYVSEDGVGDAGLLDEIGYLGR